MTNDKPSVSDIHTGAPASSREVEQPKKTEVVATRRRKPQAPLGGLPPEQRSRPSEKLSVRETILEARPGALPPRAPLSAAAIEQLAALGGRAIETPVANALQRSNARKLLARQQYAATIQTAMVGLGISLAKQFTSRSYLLSLNQALEALSDPERQGKVFVGGVAQSMVPFSAATRQLSQDSYMRDARTVTDKMLQVVPGMSETLPPKFNWLGQPILNRQGLWSDDNGTLVDIETVRLGLEGSSVMGPPSYTMGFKGSEVDLRDITLTTGENAYIKLQELSGKPGPNAKPLRDVIAKVMASPAYQRAPDGSIETPLTRPWMLARVVSKYRTAAAKRIQQDANVREGLSKAQRKVKDHFAHLKAEPTEEQRGGLKAVLEAFGAGD